MARVGQEEEKYGIRESLLNLFRDLEVERKDNLQEVKWSLIGLGLET
jgi:hypothetical protein